MKGFAKIIGAMALVLLTINLCACSTGETGSVSGSDESVAAIPERLREDEGVYMASIEMLTSGKAGEAGFTLSAVRDGKLYMEVNKKDPESGYYDTYLRILDMDTHETIGDDIAFTDEDAQISPFEIMPLNDGGYLCKVFSDNDVWLYTCDAEGKTAAKKSLRDIPQIAGSTPRRGMYEDDKYLYLSFGSGMVVLDKDYRYIGKVTDKSTEHACIGGDGLVYKTVGYEGDICSYNPALNETSETLINIPNAYDIYKGAEDELLVASATSLKSYNPKTGEVMKLFNFTDVDIASQYFTYMCRENNGDIHIFYEVQEDAPDKGIMFTPYHAKVVRYNPDEAPVREIIKVACTNLDSDVKEVIREFNLAHPDKRIKVKSYYDDYGDYETAIAAFDRDLIEHDVFDVIILTYSNLNKYSSKGLFEDLMPRLKEDSSLDLSNYYENILFAAAEGDKLYALTAEASIDCYVADKTVFGEQEALSLQDIIEARNKYTDIPFMSYGYSAAVLRNPLESDYRVFLGGEDGKYNFKTAEFKELAEFAASFPTWDEENLTKYLRDSVSEKNALDGIEKLWQVSMGGPQVYIQDRIWFGKNFKTYEIMTLEGGGYTLHPSTTFGISATSLHKDDAWELIKAIIDYKPTHMYTGFKANKECFEYSMEQLYEATHLSGGYALHTDYGVYRMTMEKEDFDTLRSMVEKATVAKTPDSMILRIIGEEMPAYFAGEKTLDDVIKIMQKRVDLYLEEGK